MAEGVRVTARASFSRSTKYYISVGDASYGRCRKKWEDFEDLYDSLELRYGKLDISFPVYATRCKLISEAICGCSRSCHR
mmetsp:Transcript_25097/g.82817  ORF Transcript_25097/g.82817 Transcript_25097/m.82817 type:complete len:80 (+) Transcript_25097:203-442(+)